MDIEPQNTQSISDDQELAKVLAGINPDDEVTTVDEMPMTTTPFSSPEPTTTEIPDLTPTPVVEEPVLSPVSGPSDLITIKRDALTALRPLVGKLDLSPEDKFDTYLLLIRSTDDKTLVQPAYEAAQKIADETRKAQALIEIVKEIDYLNPPTV